MNLRAKFAARAIALLSCTWTALRGPAQDAEPARTADLQRQQQQVFRAALRRVAPCVVRIETIGGAQPVRAVGEGDERVAAGFRQADGPTTGVIWSADGLIVSSSFNFIRDPAIITVALGDGRRFVGKLVARDQAARLALVKVEAADLPVPQWLPTPELRPGQWALAAGFGHGSDEPAVSVGVVSALGRMSGLAVQTDAKISPANYGGPLFDIEGRVIGVCVPMGPGEDEIAGVEWYDSGIGFAVPHEHLARRVPRLMQGRDLRRGLLGVMLDLRDPVQGGGEDERPGPVAGVTIVEITPGPAAAGGLQPGDILTHIDGLPTPRPLDFRRAMAQRFAGDAIEAMYHRAGETRTAKLTLSSADEIRALAPTSQPAP